MASALSVAHATSQAVTVAWVRTRPHGPVQVLVGGVDAHPGPDGYAVSFPPGARGRPIDQTDADAALSALTWTGCLLTLDTTEVADELPAHSLEDLYALTGQPVGLLVIARPLSDDDVAGPLAELSDEIAKLESLRAGRGVHRRQLARAEGNLDYLDRNSGAGCWQLEVWAGGADAAGARGTAGMLAGSSDVVSVPLILRASGSDPVGERTWDRTAIVGTDVVATVARPPFRELPGVRTCLVPDFDQNVEDSIDVRLGSVLDGSRVPAAPFGISTENINRHVFVTGATGGGKSETVRKLLLSLHQRRTPWMVVEPAKAEYASLARWLDPQRPIVVLRPGAPDLPPPMINPLEPSSIMVDGRRWVFPLQTHLDLIKALFTASFDAVEPFPQVLEAGLTRAYQSRGWNVVTGTAVDPTLSAPVWPVLGDVVRESLSVVEGLGYASDVRSNVRGFIRVRVDSLRSGTPGRFFEGGFPVDLDDLLKRPVVFEIEDLGDDRDKAFFIGTIILRLVELLRLRHRFGRRATGLQHVLVIEEAHRLLRRVSEESPSAHAVTMFANLLAEIRSYGEGVVVAEQIPSKVIPDLIKNSAVKVVHRLPADDDRQAVGATMNLSDDQSQHVVALSPGVAVAHAAGMDRPVLVKIDAIGSQRPTGAERSMPALGPRSASCPVRCADQPCSLAAIEAARDLTTPAVQFWAEQFLLGHLTGDPTGVPTGLWFSRLTSADPGRVRCAIGMAIATAVDRRAGWIRDWLDPSALQADLARRMSRTISSGQAQPDTDRWLVGQFRFVRIRRELTNPEAAGDRAAPHPLTGRWRAARIDLPGTTWATQAKQADDLARRSPLVRPWQLAGDPPVLDELAIALGHRAESRERRILAVVYALGLEGIWIPARVGAKGE